jgi:hypothetical protein
MTADPGAADRARWHEAVEVVRAQIRRVDDIADDLRHATADLHWRGPGAGRFRWRTERRLRELADQRSILTLLTATLRRAGEVHR